MQLALFFIKMHIINVSKCKTLDLLSKSALDTVHSELCNTKVQFWTTELLRGILEQILTWGVTDTAVNCLDVSVRVFLNHAI